MKILKNFIVLVFSRGVELVAMMLLIALLTRYLGVELFGTYSLIVTIVAIVQPLITLELNRILVHEFRDCKQQVDKEKLLTSGIFVRLIMICLVFLVLISATPFLGLNTQHCTDLLLLFTAESSILVIRVGYSVFLFEERMEFLGILNTTLRFFQLCFCLFAMYLGLGLQAIILAYFLAGIISSLLTILVMKRWFFIPRWNFDKANFLFIFKASLPFGIAIFLNQLLFRVDILFLNFMGTLSDVAFYNAPHRLVFSMRLLAMSLVTAILPRLSATAHVDKEKFLKLFHIVFQLLFIVCLPINILTFYYPADVMQFFFGDDFVSAADAMLVIGQSVIFLVLMPLFTTVLMIFRQQRYMPWVSGSAFALNCILDYMLIPVYGYLGAAYATIISYFAACGIYCIFTAHFVKMPPVRMLLKPVFAAFCMVLVIIYCKQGMSSLIGIGSGLLSYIVTLLLCKGVPFQEMRGLKRGHIKRKKLSGHNAQS